VAGGIFAGFFLLAIEIAFKRRKDKREKDIEISRGALIHWRKKIEVLLSLFYNQYLNH
jgi:ionotropic glutamate receptor NMDA 1